MKIQIISLIKRNIMKESNKNSFKKINLMSKIIQNKTLKTIFLFMIFISCSMVGFSQEAATTAIPTEIPKEDTRTIAEWSVFSGTQIFAILMIIMIVLIITVFVLSDVIKNLLKSDKFKEKMKSGLKTIIFILGFTFFSDSAFAAGKSPEAKSIIQLSDTMFWALVSINGVLLLVVLYLMNFMKWVLREMNPLPEAVKAETWWSKLMVKLTDAVPVEKEEVVMTDHEYDGIRELDNNLPPWWVYGFYVTIIFAFIYIFHFHVFQTGDLQAAEYEKEMATAQAEVEAYLKSQANNVDETNAELLTDAAALAEGKTIFETNCWQCHKKDGGGQTGPNLTDAYWLHGGDIKDVFKTVKYGVTSKSMPSWKDQLTPIQIHRVSSYVKSLQGTKPAEPKAPEGDLYSEKVTEEKTVPESDSLSVKDTLN
jgi:cytochrome c oxidase cbb3-type subunit 3